MGSKQDAKHELDQDVLQTGYKTWAQDVLLTGYKNELNQDVLLTGYKKWAGARCSSNRIQEMSCTKMASNRIQNRPRCSSKVRHQLSTNIVAGAENVSIKKCSIDNIINIYLNCILHHNWRMAIYHILYIIYIAWYIIYI